MKVKLDRSGGGFWCLTTNLLRVANCNFGKAVDIADSRLSQQSGLQMDLQLSTGKSLTAALPQTADYLLLIEVLNNTLRPEVNFLHRTE